MRVLVNTLYGKNIIGYGPFENYRSWVMTAVKNRDDVFIEFVIPKNKVRSFNYDEDAVRAYLHHPRIRLHPVEMLKGGLQQWAAVPLELYDLFNLTRTKIYYDAMLSNWTASHPVMKRAMQRKTARNMLDIPIFGYPTNVSKLGETPLRDAEVLGICVGMATDYVGFLTEGHKKGWMRDCRKFISPAMLRKINTTACIASMGGLNCELIDSIKPKTYHPKVQIIGYGGQFTEVKGFNEMLDLCSFVNSVRPKMRATFTTGDPVNSSELEKKYPFAKFYGGVNHNDYFSHAKRWDLGLCLSKVEGTGMGYQEMMYCGTMLCFLDGPFAHEITPEGYPFIVNSVAKMKEMLIYMIDNPAKVKKWVKPVREHLRNISEETEHNLKILDWMRETTTAHYSEKKINPKTALAGVILKAARKLKEPFSYSDFSKSLEKLTKSKYDQIGSFLGPFFIRNILMGLGYRDICRGTEPEFVNSKPYAM
jgi:hypothetical protein